MRKKNRFISHKNFKHWFLKIALLWAVGNISIYIVSFTKWVDPSINKNIQVQHFTAQDRQPRAFLAAIDKFDTPIYQIHLRLELSKNVFHLLY